MTDSLISRFWIKVSLPHCGGDHDACDECCWPWLGAHNNKGYGQLGIGGRVDGLTYAHRLSWEIHRGPIPEGLLVLHHCDNPPCVNPGHLFLGTVADNSADMVAKGRHFSRTKPERLARGERHGTQTKPERVARGERSGARTHPEKVARGESNGKARLTEERVRDIRRRAAAGESISAIARSIGMSFTPVWAVVRNKAWTHVVLALLIVLTQVSPASAEGYTRDDVLAAIDQSSVEIGVSSAYLYRVVACETGGSFDPYSVGRQGELGPVQLHPRGLLRTFFSWGYLDPFSPYQAVRFLAQEVSFGRAAAWSCA